MRPLGHRTYLATKVSGESSMSGKAGFRETINRDARRDPDGMAKARLLEVECPYRQGNDLDTMVDIQGLEKTRRKQRREKG